MKKIKKRNQSIPIVALTASAFYFNGDLDNTIDSFDGYLQKPVERAQIVKEIAKYIGLEDEDTSADKKSIEEISVRGLSEKEQKELSERLDKDISVIFSTIDTDTILMDQYENLLKRLRSIEHELPDNRLIQFDRKLESAINYFDIEQIRDLAINEYPKLIVNLNG